MKFLGSLLARSKAGKLRAARSLTEKDLRHLQDELVALGSDAIEPLGECLAHAEARGPALEVLERLASDARLDRYLMLLRSPNPAVVSGIVRVLAASRALDARLLLDELDGAELPRAVLDPLVRAHFDELPAHEFAARLVASSRDVQQSMVRALDHADNPNLAPAMLPLLEHEDSWLRATAARFVACNPVPGTLAALERALRDPAKQVRLEAVTGLCALGARESVPSLLEALRDPDLHVQVAVVGALHELADVAAVPGLVHLLGDESEHVRRGAVEVLNAVATADAIEDLARAMRDADWWVRVRAADALGTLGGERVVAAATALLRDPDEALRRQAIELLNAVPGSAAVPALISALDDPDWWVSERAIDALGKSGDERAVEPLMACTEGAPAVAVLAARALAVLASPRALPTLLGLLDSPVPEVRAEAEAALASFPREGLDASARSGLDAVRARLVGASAPVSAIAASPPVRARGASLLGDSSHRLEASASLAGGRTPVSPQPAFRPGAIATFGLDFTDVPAGQEFLDRYTIVRRLGRGGYGTVYLANDRVLGEEVVLKVLNPQLSMDQEAARRFVQELKLARRIAHRGVIRIHDFLDLGGARAISMEYFAGRDLGRVIAAEAPLAVRRSLAIVAQVCDALAAAHAEGVVHRDIKPGNVLVSDEDETRLVDFGLAAAHHSSGEGSRLTRSGLLIGTPEYMAPEQITNEVVDHRADLYALGIVMYEMLSGRKPYVAETPVKVLFQHLEGSAPPLVDAVPGTPDIVSALVARAMARDASARPDTAAELRAAITRALDALATEE